MGKTLRQRFWEKIDVAGPDECWNWTAGLHSKKDPYGKFKLGGKDVRAHRVMYAWTYGPISEGNVVRHKCDNPTCVNPCHLEVGTQADNMRDKVLRGRSVDQKGEANRSSKLTEADVLEIRTSKETQVALAKRFGVAQPQVSNIKNRKTWTHI